MKNTIAILLLIACVLGGCSKIFKSNPNSFTVTGTLLEDCGGKPIANASVRADMYGDHTFNSDVLGIGNAVTDANGHFSMKCTTTFFGHLVLGVNGVKYIENFVVSPKYPDINFKNIYGLIQQAVYIKVVAGGSSYTPADTLFIDATPIHPIVSKGYIESNLVYGSNFIDQSVITNVDDPNNILRIDTGHVGWGIGINDYQHALKNAMIPPYTHIIKYIRLGCAGTDTAVINIP
jgi:hypothetical protein